MYNGKAQIIAEVQDTRVEIQAEARGLEKAALTSICEPGSKVPEAETVQSRYITNWEMAEWMPEEPEKVDGNYSHLPSYHPVEIGHGTQLHDLWKNSGFLVYHCHTDIPKDRKGEPLYLQFELLEGKASITVELKTEDAKRVNVIEVEKPYEEPDKLALKMEGDGDASQADIWVCMEIFSSFHGITKPVRWEFRMEEAQ